MRRIVGDITGLYPRWHDLVHRYELVAAQARPEWGESAEQVELMRQIEDVAHEINVYLRELEKVGCLFKGFEDGLVDFYGRLDGRDIFWCWKQGRAVAVVVQTVTGFIAGRDARRNNFV